MLIVADENIPFVKEAFSTLTGTGTIGFCEVRTISGRDINPKTVEDADILLVRSITKVNKQLLESSSVKFVATATIGFDHIDLEYLKKRNIGFSSAPGSNSNSVAEYIIASLLVLHKKKKISLENIKLGVVGVGNVGSKVVQKAQGLGIKVLQNDPPRARISPDPAVFLPLDELMDCDVISLHVPLTREGIDTTYQFFDKKRISKMKKGSILINTSRGRVIVESELKSALKNKHLKGAILDVWKNEPEIDTELLGMVDIGTPHIAGYSFDGKVNGTIMIYKDACKFFNVAESWKPVMPEPLIPFIEQGIDRKNHLESYLETMADIVKKIYDIENDDLLLRKLFNLSATERGKYFDNLRKNYTVRREFFNTRLKLLSGVPDTTDIQIKNKFRAIGFTLT